MLFTHNTTTCCHGLVSPTHPSTLGGGQERPTCGSEQLSAAQLSSSVRTPQRARRSAAFPLPSCRTFPMLAHSNLCMFAPCLESTSSCGRRWLEVGWACCQPTNYQIGEVHAAWVRCGSLLQLLSIWCLRPCLPCPANQPEAASGRLAAPRSAQQQLPAPAQRPMGAAGRTRAVYCIPV